MSQIGEARSQSDEKSLPEHVLHVFNDVRGGAALTTLGLICGLTEAGVTSSIYSNGSDNSPIPEELIDAVEGRIAIGPLVWWNKKIRSPLWRRPLGASRQFVRTGAGRASTHAVTQFARQQGIDFVHTNTVLTPEGASAAAILRLPHIWHVRELVGPGELFRFWAERRRFAARVSARSDLVIANSHVCADRLANLMPCDRIAVIPNGVADDGFLAIAPPTGRRPVVVGMVANLVSHWKRQELFLRAAAKTRDHATIFKVFGYAPPAGTDAYADNLRNLVVELGLGQRISFEGFRPSPVEIMQEIDVLVHPATNESFGRIVVEAMLAGRPVVGVDQGGVGELVSDGESGLLAPTPDSDLLANRIDRLVADPELRVAYGEAGRKIAQRDFSAPLMVERVLAVYRQVLQARAVEM